MARVPFAFFRSFNSHYVSNSITHRLCQSRVLALVRTLTTEAKVHDQSPHQVCHPPPSYQNSCDPSHFSEPHGALGTQHFRQRFFVNGDGGQRVEISPWHDIPLSHHFPLAPSHPQRFQDPKTTKKQHPFDCFENPCLERALAQIPCLFHHAWETHLPTDVQIAKVIGCFQASRKLTDSSSSNTPQSTDNPNFVFNMVTEIPKGATRKFEIGGPAIPFNAIIPDEKPDGSLREFHKPLQWNYGAIPQTWETPTECLPGFSLKGDGDPMDIVELGATPLPLGSIVPVQVLGCLALIDEDELDWKILAIRAPQHCLNNNDHTTFCDRTQTMTPRISEDTLHTIREWFRSYKTVEGKKQNTYLFEERLLSPWSAAAVILESHRQWRRLREEPLH